MVTLHVVQEEVQYCTVAKILYEPHFSSHTCKRANTRRYIITLLQIKQENFDAKNQIRRQNRFDMSIVLLEKF